MPKGSTLAMSLRSKLPVRTASDDDTRKAVIRLAFEKPHLRRHLLPLLRKSAEVGYTSREITIPVGYKDETRTFKADVKGVWAVHPSLTAERTWTITHVPTGLALKVGLRGEQLAKAIVDAILAKEPDLLTVKTESEIRNYRDVIVKVLKRPPRGKPTPVTVEEFLFGLLTKLKKWDERLSRRDDNIFRLSHYLEAWNKIDDDVASVKHRSDKEAMDLLRQSISRRFIVREMPPAQKLLDAMSKWEETGRRPRF